MYIESHIPQNTDFGNMNRLIEIDFPRLREAAKTKGLTVREIATRAGEITHGTVHSILNGKTDPSARNIKRVCNVLDIPIEDVFIEEAA